MATPSQGILTLKLPDREALHRAFMPFLKIGGIFVPTPHRYRMGQEIFVLLTLPEETEKRPVAGRVAWIHTASAAGRPPGIGIQFMESPQSDALRSRIEVLLTGFPGSDTPTHTM